MPIEIRELQIRATVPETGSTGSACDQFRFGDPVPDAGNARDGTWDDAGLAGGGDRADPGAPDGAATQHAYSGGLAMPWDDGSAPYARDGFDPFS